MHYILILTLYATSYNAMIPDSDMHGISLTTASFKLKSVQKENKPFESSSSQVFKYHDSTCISNKVEWIYDSSEYYDVGILKSERSNFQELEK